MNIYTVTDYNTETEYAFNDPHDALKLRNLMYDAYLLADDDNTFRANRVICSMIILSSDPVGAFEHWKTWNDPLREE